MDWLIAFGIVFGFAVLSFALKVPGNTRGLNDELRKTRPYLFRKSSPPIVAPKRKIFGADKADGRTP
jgi:hypothetical protein